MANDRNKGNEQDRDREQRELQDARKRNPTFGEGMDSPDSTEAALDATTGLPDPRARERRAPGQEDDEDAGDQG